MNDGHTYELQTTDGGHQALVENIQGVVSTDVVPDGQRVVSRTVLEITPERFRLFVSKSMTHNVKIDTISGRTTLMPKNTDTRADTPAQKRNRNSA